jgi:hypothetical protein
MNVDYIVIGAGSAGCVVARSHALRGNVSEDAPRLMPQSGTVYIPTQSVGTRT